MRKDVQIAVASLGMPQAEIIMQVVDLPHHLHTAKRTQLRAPFILVEGSRGVHRRANMLTAI